MDASEFKQNRDQKRAQNTTSFRLRWRHFHQAAIYLENFKRMTMLAVAFLTVRKVGLCVTKRPLCEGSLAVLVSDAGG